MNYFNYLRKQQPAEGFVLIIILTFLIGVAFNGAPYTWSFWVIEAAIAFIFFIVARLIWKQWKLYGK